MAGGGAGGSQDLAHWRAAAELQLAMSMHHEPMHPGWMYGMDVSLN